MTSPFYLQIRSYLSRITGFSMQSLPLSLGYAVFRTFILEARERLKANCRNKASMAFLTILGNLARKALLCKWESPKYCSTIYRTLEIALFRAISYSVSSAPVVSLRLVPFRVHNAAFYFIYGKKLAIRFSKISLIRKNLLNALQHHLETIKRSINVESATKRSILRQQGTGKLLLADVYTQNPGCALQCHSIFLPFYFLSRICYFFYGVLLLCICFLCGNISISHFRGRFCYFLR